MPIPPTGARAFRGLVVRIFNDLGGGAELINGGLLEKPGIMAHTSDVNIEF